MKRSRNKPGGKAPSVRSPRRVWRGIALSAGSLLAVVGATAWVVVRQPTIRMDRLLDAYHEHPVPGGLSVLFPPDGALFPPEMAAPTVRWQDDRAERKVWIVAVDFTDGGPRMRTLCDAAQWTPDKEDWEEIKRRTREKPAKITVLGLDRACPDAVRSAGSAALATSADEVGTPIFYREVDLPFIESVRDPARHIRWRFGSVASAERPPVVLEGLPVCANCHSFSRDGATLGMDVDYGNDKGAYIVRPVAPEMTLDREQVFTWSDYRREDRQPTFGLLSQVSPDGRYVVSTVKDRSVFLPMPDLTFSQLFFPVQGILAVYDRQTKGFFALPGADDPEFVQSNPAWSPDGKQIVFARAKAHRLKHLADNRRVLLSREDCPEFLKEGGQFQYDLYRVPFNGGKGGKAEPLPGASHNGSSNYFAKYSPDGKWIVFCRSKSFMLLQPDSELYILPAEGGEARRLRCNTARMNSWHSWSPNGHWLVFSSKANSPYTQLFLTHIDAAGESTPAVVLDQFTAPDKAANIPEFVPAPPNAIVRIEPRFLNEQSYIDTAGHNAFYGDFDLAIEFYRKALELNPRSAAALEGLGTVRVRQGRLKEARETLCRALELDPDRKYAHFYLAEIEAKDGRFAEAMHHYRETVRLAPEDAPAHAALGSLLADAGNVEEAKRHLLQAARLDKNNPLPHVALGILLAREGVPEKAVASFQEALKADPRCVPALVQLSSIRAISDRSSLRDPEEAIRLADQGCQLTGRHDPGALLALAVAYQAAGREAEAMLIAEAALGIARAAEDARSINAIEKRLDQWRRRPKSAD